MGHESFGQKKKGAVAAGQVSTPAFTDQRDLGQHSSSRAASVLHVSVMVKVHAWFDSAIATPTTRTASAETGR